MFQAQLKKGLAVNMYMNGVWGSCMSVPYKQSTVQVEHAFISTTKAGDIDTLTFVEGKLSIFKLVHIFSVPIDENYFVELFIL